MEGGAKMKSWKKQLKKEIQRSIPALSKEIIEYPIETMAIEPGRSKKKYRFTPMLAISGILAILLVLVISIWALYKPIGSSPQTYLYTVDINPSVSFITDENGVVLSAHSLNEDADVILASKVFFENIPVTEAIVLFVEQAARLGYFDISALHDGVCISKMVEDDTGQLANIKDSLQQYFCTAGFYGIVIEKQFSLEEFCKKANISLNTEIENIAQVLKEFGPLYEARGITEENLEKLYEEFVLGKQVLALVKDDLCTNLEAVIHNAKLLLEIISLNGQIMFHEKNPNMFLKDYWNVKRLANGDYDKDFAILMDEMSRKLLAYESEFHTSLSSLEDVTKTIQAYEAVPFDQLESLSNLDIQSFLANPSQYIKILKNIGIDVSTYEFLLTKPNTIEDFKDKMYTSLDEVYKEKELKNQEEFNKDRQEITDDEYKQFLKRIEEEYGSLQEYWEIKILK